LDAIKEKNPAFFSSNAGKQQFKAILTKAGKTESEIIQKLQNKCDDEGIPYFIV